MVYCLAAFLSRNYFSILSPTSRDQEEKSLFVNPTLAFRPLFESVRFSSSVVSDTLRPHGLQHTRLPCPSPTLKAFSNLCPLSRWCHPTISSPVVPFSCPQSFPASVFSSESALHIRWPEYWGFSFSISPSNEYSGLVSFRIDWFDLLAVQGILKSFSTTTIWKHEFFGAQPSIWFNWNIQTWLLERWYVCSVISNSLQPHGL